VLTKFAHGESWLSGRERQRGVVFYAPVNLCDRRACSTSVAVGIKGLTNETGYLYTFNCIPAELRTRENTLYIAELP
jgi:hypothetical protein